MTADELTSLVSSRICHDLISPIGAIANGVELLSGLSSQTSPEMELIAESVDVAAIKLRYFRIAFGAAAIGSEVRTIEVAELARTMFGGRFKVTIAIEASDIPRRAAKALMLALMCMERSLPVGGETVVTNSGDALVLESSGGRVKADPDLWAAVAGQANNREINASEVQFSVLGIALAESGTVLETHFEAEACRLVLKGCL